MHAADAVVFADDVDAARPERRPLRELAFDTHEIGRVGFDDEMPVDEHHVAAARLDVHVHQPVDDRTHVEEFVVRGRQRRLRPVRCGLHRVLLCLQRFQEHVLLDDAGTVHPGDLEREPVLRIERRPRVERRGHLAAAGRCAEMTERAVADERLIVGREEAVEQRACLVHGHLGQTWHDRQRDEGESKRRPLPHAAIIDLSEMKIGLVSLGCPKNLVDSEVMLGLAQQAGHQLTRDPEGADVIVVNTCAFIDSAKQESIDTILEMARHKTDGSCQRLIVTGCMAERYRDELKKEIPEIDAVLGTGEVPDIVRAIGGGASSSGVSPLNFFRASSPEPRAASPEPRGLPTYIYDADTPRLLATPKHYAYVKIAEGCDYKCAFCIIPTLRGAYRSRPEDSVVREAEGLRRAASKSCC